MQKGRRMRNAFLTSLVTASLLGALGLFGIHSDPAYGAGDLRYRPYGGAWNGKRIYLSPARHRDSGSRGECGVKGENTFAFYAAWDATNGTHYGDRYRPDSPWRNLRGRGYKVRIGRGTVASAIRRSNRWKAHRHIPIHSNADVHNRCGRTGTAGFGTWLLYLDGHARAKNLSQTLKNTVGAYSGFTSPGTGDRVCRNIADDCTQVKPLGELKYTNRPAAYMESEFHTWNRGHDWLGSSQQWAWRIAWAVDLHLGYP